jgi:hypothetical protein
MPRKSERFPDELRKLWPVMKGSLAEVELTCGTPQCRCHAGGPKHRGFYFSYRLRGRSHTVYVPRAVLEDVRHAHAQWLALKVRLEEFTARRVEELRQRATRERQGRKEEGHGRLRGSSKGRRGPPESPRRASPPDR